LWRSMERMCRKRGWCGLAGLGGQVRGAARAWLTRAVGRNDGAAH
jgi:hypothetical protein